MKPNTSADEVKATTVRSTVSSLESDPRSPTVMSSSKSIMVGTPADLIAGPSSHPVVDPGRLNPQPRVQQANPNQPPNAAVDRQSLRPERKLVLTGSKSYSGATVISAGELSTPDNPVQDAKDISKPADSIGPTVPPLRPERTMVISGSKSLSGVIPSEQVSPRDREQEAKAIADAAPEYWGKPVPEPVRPKRGTDFLESSADYAPNDDERPPDPVEPYRNPTTMQGDVAGAANRLKVYGWQSSAYRN